MYLLYFKYFYLNSSSFIFPVGVHSYRHWAFPSVIFSPILAGYFCSSRLIIRLLLLFSSSPCFNLPNFIYLIIKFVFYLDSLASHSTVLWWDNNDQFTFALFTIISLDVNCFDLLPMYFISFRIICLTQRFISLFYSVMLVLPNSTQDIIIHLNFSLTFHLIFWQLQIWSSTSIFYVNFTFVSANYPSFAQLIFFTLLFYLFSLFFMDLVVFSLVEQSYRYPYLFADLLEFLLLITLTHFLIHHYLLNFSNLV